MLEPNPPIDAVISAGIIPRFVELLTSPNNDRLKVHISLLYFSFYFNQIIIVL